MDVFTQRLGDDQMASKKQTVKVTKSEAEAPKRAMKPTERGIGHEIEQAFHRVLESWPMLGRRWHLPDVDPFAKMELPSVFSRDLRVPRVDMVETDAGYELTAELPGLTEKDVECTLSGNTLTVKGQRREEKEEKRKDYYLKERSVGSFERRLTVPEEVDVDKLAASVSAGVLKVVLPKKPEARKARKIDVKNG
jgi:HSP20 family protein